MTLRRTFLAAYTTLALAACAGTQPATGGASPEGGDEMTIQVVNNYSAPVEVSSLWSPARSQHRLGRVGTGEEGEFSEFWRHGEFRLVVESQASRRTTTSNPIELGSADRGVTLVLTISQTLEAELVRQPPGS